MYRNDRNLCFSFEADGKGSFLLEDNHNKEPCINVVARLAFLGNRLYGLDNRHKVLPRVALRLASPIDMLTSCGKIRHQPVLQF
jgi:hypothetical protein